jgi:hypothetical protein
VTTDTDLPSFTFIYKKIKQLLFLNEVILKEKISASNTRKPLTTTRDEEKDSINRIEYADSKNECRIQFKSDENDQYEDTTDGSHSSDVHERDVGQTSSTLTATCDFDHEKHVTKYIVRQFQQT